MILYNYTCFHQNYLSNTNKPATEHKITIINPTTIILTLFAIKRTVTLSKRLIEYNPTNQFLTLMCQMWSKNCLSEITYSCFTNPCASTRLISRVQFHIKIFLYKNFISTIFTIKLLRIINIQVSFDTKIDIFTKNKKS